jgi:hypothetical protein
MSWTLRHIALFATTLLCGCQVTGRARAPAPERALASEGLETPASSSTTTGTDETAEHDEEPDHGQPTDDDEPDLTTGDTASDVAVASRYAALDRRSCESELERRHIAFERVAEARGVVAPLRLTGPLSGVTFRSVLSPEKSRVSPFDIYDCRLVLSLDDFARTILVKHDIVEVTHLSVYRPPTTRAELKDGKRHHGALAIDAAVFRTKAGRRLTVERDFSPRRIGAKPCPAPANASELRQIACEANQARLFNVLLTPDFNWAHRNHFHMEVTSGVRWTLVR